MPEEPKHRGLRILIWCALGGIALVFGTIEIVQWRSAVAWKNFKEKWEAQGESFDLHAYLPDPVPRDENLMHHPVFEGFMEDDHPLRLHETSDLLNDSRLKDHDYCEPSTWSPDELEAIAADLAPLQTLLDETASALALRPKCRFPNNYDLGFEMPTAHIFNLLKLAAVYDVDFRHSLETGDSSRALDCLLTNRRLARAAGSDLNLMAHLVDLEVQKVAMKELWHGLQRHAFDAGQLARLAQEFHGTEQLPERFMTVMRVERAMALHFIDQVENGAIGMAEVREAFGEMLGHYPGFLRPIVFNRSRIAACEPALEFLLHKDGRAQSRPHRDDGIRAWKSVDKRWGEASSRLYFELFGAISTPHFDTAIDRTLDREAELTNARLAIALERHRLAHRSYPPGLPALVPDYLPELPTDRINNRPVEYRLKPDGTPLLYQWGCDGDDDGGTPRQEPAHGDVVWQYTLDRPLTTEEWTLED